jgi:hypothetical protein
MQTNICVLKSGGEFKPEHVQRLAKQVPDLICLSDVEIEGVKTIPLLYNWPKWWAKLELFRPDIAGDLFYIDLDSTVIRMPVMPDVTTVLTDFGDKSVIATGLMFMKSEDKSIVWDSFIMHPNKAMSEHVAWPSGDGGFINRFYHDKQRWQDIANIYSYKLHCGRGVPIDAEIVCHHGKPRPWEI